jgi:hypothetical protein
VSKKALALVVASLSLVACQKGKSTEATATSAPIQSATAAATTAAATTAAAPPAPASAQRVVVPIPAIDEKLPAEKLNLAAFVKAVKADKTKLVGKKIHVEGEVHGVSLRPMVFDAEKHGLHGPEKEGTPGGVYGVEVRGKTADDTISCFVDRPTSEVLGNDVMSLKKIHVVVEGIVEPTFGDLAPCKIVSKKIDK